MHDLVVSLISGALGVIVTILALDFVASHRRQRRIAELASHKARTRQMYDIIRAKDQEHNIISRPDVQLPMDADVPDELNTLVTAQFSFRRCRAQVLFSSHGQVEVRSNGQTRVFSAASPFGPAELRFHLDKVLVRSVSPSPG